MTGDRRVSERLAALCLDAAGHVPDNVYLDMALRGAVLVELALVGRLGQTEDSIELDPRPLGRPVTDRALAELDALDGRSLDWWLEHSGLGLDEVAADQVAGGSWSRARSGVLRTRPRFEDHGGSRPRDESLIAGAAVLDDVEDAVLVAIATTVHVGGPPAVAVAEVLEQTEPVRWICQLVTDFLEEARARGIAVSSASQSALWSGSIPY